MTYGRALTKEKTNVKESRVKVKSKLEIIEERNDRKFQNDFLRNRKETVNVISLNKDFQKKLDRKNELNYGIEFIY